MKHRSGRLQKTLAAVLIGAPVLVLLLGGVYSWPAIRYTKGREPWLSLFLAAGLAVTIFGLGLASRVPVLNIGGVWVIALLLLLARGVYGTLDHNLEGFGIVHALALTATMALIFLTT